MTNEEAIRELKAMYEHILPHMSIMGTEAYDMAIEALEQQPKVGVWLKNGDFCKCSNCHNNVLFSKIKYYNYCYHCGAKMEPYWG